MHPLRFPNSGIKAKVFVRKIGFKLRVIRLNRVESFYALLLCFRSKGNEERGWLAMARPFARVAGHGLATRKGAVGSVAYGQSAHGRACGLGGRARQGHQPARAAAPGRGQRWSPATCSTAACDGGDDRRMRAEGEG
ncbi:hypothetical protein BHM03_00046348 [Ensete ventricosum]|nr:hypothetical protein BHM03_00046348 [Ensete ventricosum]